MKKDLGVLPAVFPMPVLIVASYDKDGTVQAMNAAWGMTCESDKIALFIDADHATTKAINQSKAFTVSLADKAHMEAADFFGIATGNKMPDKFEKSGCHAEKSQKVNAPVIQEFPVTLECELVEITNTENVHAIVGKIVNVLADEKVLSENGKVEPLKLDALIFDQFQNGYYVATEKVGQAWNAGREMMKAAQK